MPILKRSGSPSYGRGFARSASESESPGLWSGCKGLWLPTLGPIGTSGALLRDISGFGNHGTLSNQTQSDWAVSGNPTLPGHALNFDNNDNHVEIPASSSIDDLSPLSVCGWMQLTDIASQDWVSKAGVGGATSGWRIINGLNNRQLRFLVNGSGTLEKTTVTSTIPVAGDWFHWCVTWEGTMAFADVHIYIDGQEASYFTETDGAGRVSDANDSIFFGKRRPADTSANLRMATVGLWNRILLFAEIKQLHEQPAAMFTRRRRIYASAVAAAGSPSPRSHLYGPLVGSLGGPI